MTIKPVSSFFSPETKRQVYINEVWSKYPLEQRIEMSNLLKKEGETFKEINRWECLRIATNWELLKKKLGWQ